MEEETFEERQKNELEALKAIFGDDLVDIRKKKAWNAWSPLNLMIRLSPQRSHSNPGQSFGQIEFFVKCPSRYPDVVPTISLKNERGLSSQDVANLEKELNKMAQRNVGEVMIFDLAQLIETFLHEHCRPSDEANKSFWDEMFHRKEAARKKQLHDEQKQQESELQSIRDDFQRRQELYKAQVKDRRERLLDEFGERPSRRRHTSSSGNIDGLQCEHRGTKTIQFNNRNERQIFRGKCLGHSERGSVTFAGLDAITGESIVVHEWCFKLKGARGDSATHDTHLHDLSHCMRSVENIEQEFNFLSKFRHSNLVSYLAFKYVNENDSLMVLLLQEYVPGISLSNLKESMLMHLDVLRYLAQGILTALDFLHKNNVIHRRLTTNNVFLTTSGVVKIADYSLDQRLYEVYRNEAKSSQQTNKKSDIYYFGLLILSLINGHPVDNECVGMMTNLPLELKDFLTRCLTKEEIHRWSAAQLLKHNFIRTPLQHNSPARQLQVPKIPKAKGDTDEGIDQGVITEDDDIDKFTSLPDCAGHSRLHTEFELAKWLGKGAYGDVLKVKNKLDGGIYAIKRIRLDPKNKQQNRKIMREVKLLSRLNHENVVRYYNSWIESATIDRTRRLNRSLDANRSLSFDDETDGGQKSTRQRVRRKNTDNDDLDIDVDEVKYLHPNYLKNAEWSVSYESRSRTNQMNESEEEEESEDDDDEWEFEQSDHSEQSIVFEPSETIQTEDVTDATINKRNKSDEVSSVSVLQFMYIQMEFCEKSTLRNAIDNGLYKDADKLWRLFREIVEGLSHIHQQGMIHRDLKPVNIFLDSNDHVKIGDFGLATSNILPIITSSERKQLTGDDDDQKDRSMTGQVGTYFYVAPELNTKEQKAIYNQKVDIYSLGIILFEMLHPPMSTGMERTVILNNVRTSAIVFPDDFVMSNSKYIGILRRLLSHEPSERPTSQDILQSDEIPPPIIEEYELQEILRITLANTQSKTYKYLIDACFEQETAAADYITFDSERILYLHDPSKKPKVEKKVPNIKVVQLREKARAIVERVFKIHGGHRIDTSLLLPKSKYYENTDSCVQLMTRFGGVVSLPRDLRVPFARYVALNSIDSLKRYSLERVYREKKGFHPSELNECAFDIITPTSGSLMAEAELLAIVHEILQSFPNVRDNNLTIRLNHTSLLKAILLYIGVEEEKHDDIYQILSEMKDEKRSKFQVHTHLISLCLKDAAMNNLIRLIDSDPDHLEKIEAQWRVITKRKGEMASLAKTALGQLQLLVNNARMLGVKCNIVISPALAYNIKQYCGVTFQFVCELKKKRRKEDVDIIAAGGRYDAILNHFRSILVRTELPYRVQCGAGVSLWLDSLVTSMLSDCEQEPSVDAVLCAISIKPLLKEKCAILKKLWSHNIRCHLCESTIFDEIQEHCRELHATHLIILKETEPNLVVVRTWDKDRFQDRKLSTHELVDYIKKTRTRADSCDSISSTCSINTRTNDAKPSELSRSSNTDASSFRLSREISRSGSETTSLSTTASINVRFILEDKLSATTRRRYENQLLGQLSEKLQKFSKGTRVEVLIVQLHSQVLATISAYLDLDADDGTFSKVVASIIERHAKHKKYITQICDEIDSLRQENNKPIVVISCINGPHKIFC